MGSDLDTLRTHLDWWLDLRCGCGRVALLPIAWLAERHGLDASLPALVARMRCQACGAKPAAAALVDDGHSAGVGQPELRPVVRRPVG